MACVDLNKAVRDALSLPNDALFNCTLNKSKNDDGLLTLNVKNDTKQKEYLVVPAMDRIDKGHGQTIANDLIIAPLFGFQHTNKQKYAAFDTGKLENCIVIEKNNLGHLEIILKSLAEFQASYLTTKKEEQPNASFDVETLFNKVTARFKDYDKEAIENTKIRFQADINKFFESKLFVRSVVCPLGKNIWVNLKIKKSIILYNSKEKYVPPVYDALMSIFTFSDENFRQKHFTKLVKTYFDSLVYYLEQKNTETFNITREYKETTVRVFLPIIKFQIIIDSLATEELISNALNFLKYPLINQEDIYEIVQNKLNSSDYDLLDYKMINLNSKSGHLGQYFNLDIQINYQGRVTELHLFAKVIIPLTDFMKEIAKNGPSEKEDFFYTTLIPLYEEHGLEKLLDFAPKCYISRLNWMLVLDNLVKDRFVTFELNKNLDVDGLKCVVAKLAKLAAASLVVEENLSRIKGRPVRMNEIFGKFEESIFVYEDGHIMQKLCDNTRNGLNYFIKILPEITEHLGVSYEEKCEKFDKLFMSLFPKILTSDTFRNSIVHGDMHLGNMLFKKEQDGSVSNAILVDFQILRYLPPAFEMLIFLYANSSRETKLKHINQLIEGYYDDVARYLNDFGHDPEKVYPREHFYDSIKHVRPACLSLAFIYTYMLKADTEIREEMLLNQEKFNHYIENNYKDYVDLVWSNEYYRECVINSLKDMTDYIVENNLEP
ncbi:uncharacterized protein LOC115891606 [Sitophilus oryzae]|uniref:Uncharacterized protein LOC115891606 n=1 Tax=Sitophilus oryzae TaxID=7048 RepID=A0A6J2YXJ9_SITOR|nr:uncharacterized protein LOC115891606 [Sitophilus oryzae]